MNRLLPLGLSLAVLASPAVAQEKPKTAAETKAADTVKDSSKNTDLSEKRQRLQDAEQEIREAQRAVQKAQRDAQNAQREVERAVKSEVEKVAKIQGNVFTRPRQSRQTITYRVTRPDSKLNEAYGLELVEADAVLRAQLGLIADQGLVVTKVTEKGMADQAGIKLNDLILKLDGDTVGKVEQVRNALGKPGPTIMISLIREGKPREISMSRPKQVVKEDTTTSYWIGVPVAAVDATLRSHLTALPDGAGLIATDVVADSPAAKAGAKKNDILIKFNDKPIGTQEALVEQVQKSEGKESKVEVLRGGKVVPLTLTPEKRSTAVTGTVSATLDLGTGPQSFTFNGPALAELSRVTNFVPWTKDNDLSTQIAGNVTSWLKEVDGKPLNAIKVDAMLNGELQQQMKALTGQIEDLRKAIDEMKKALPASKDLKTNFNLFSPEASPGALGLGAF